MKQVKTLMAMWVLAGGPGWAGDVLYDEGGAYAGTVSRTFWQDSSGQYGGSVSANGSLSTASGEYAGRIQANGSITLADGSYGGHVAGWKAKGRE